MMLCGGLLAETSVTYHLVVGAGCLFSHEAEGADGNTSTNSLDGRSRSLEFITVFCNTRPGLRGLDDHSNPIIKSAS